jgi:hypothetical protein
MRLPAKRPEANDPDYFTPIADFTEDCSPVEQSEVLSSQ